jgi:hypothetical protein
MRELLYEAAKHYRRGKALADRGDARGASVAFEDALRELSAVRPQRMRDVLLAQVYLSRHQLDLDAGESPADLRLGYAYARTTAEPNVRALAERLWREAVASGRHRAPARPKATPKSERPRGDGPPRQERERDRRTGRDRRGRGSRDGGGSPVGDPPDPAAKPVEPGSD